MNRQAEIKKLDAAILRALGYDPDTYDLQPRPDHRWPGVQVVDHDGNPVHFYTEKALARKNLRVNTA